MADSQSDLDALQRQMAALRQQMAQIEQQISTAGGVAVAGDVATGGGDFVGRDQV
jgi:prefoldin subunit 5